MKTIPLFAFSGLFLALALFSSCASSGNKQADSTAMNMDDLRTTVVSLKDSVNASASSLANVVDQADVDPRPAFAEYKVHVAATKDGLERAKSRVISMRDRGEAYFAAWEKQSDTMSDPDLKEASTERRAKLSKAISSVADAMTAAEMELTPYLRSLADMQTYFNNDLTPAGIKSVKGKSKDTGKSASSISEKLDDVIEALDEGAPEFKTAKPPPARAY